MHRAFLRSAETTSTSASSRSTSFFPSSAVERAPHLLGASLAEQLVHALVPFDPAPRGLLERLRPPALLGIIAHELPQADHHGADLAARFPLLGRVGLVAGHGVAKQPAAGLHDHGNDMVDLREDLLRVQRPALGFLHLRLPVEEQAEQRRLAENGEQDDQQSFADYREVLEHRAG